MPAVSAEEPLIWSHARGRLALGLTPRVMGVVNVTPDSFHDGGTFLPPGADEANVSVVVRLCRSYRQQGAELLDVGGESTRPGAEPVPADIEARRVLPVIRALAREAELGAPISVDTRRAAIAAAAMDAGAAIINDVSGLADPDMAAVAAATGAGLIVGHLRGEPATMMREIRFERVLEEVARELGAAVERALRAGVSGDKIAVDPGIGFGKTAEQSAALVAASAYLMRETGCPVVIGASRKAFLGAITGRPVQERMLASVVAAVVAGLHGAAVVRVHDVGPTAEALKVAAAIRSAHAAAQTGGRAGW